MSEEIEAILARLELLSLGFGYPAGFSLTLDVETLRKALK